MKGRERVPTTAAVPGADSTSSHCAGGAGMDPLGVDGETCLSFSTGGERGKYLCEEKEGIIWKVLCGCLQFLEHVFLFVEEKVKSVLLEL